MASLEIRGKITKSTPEVELKGGFKCKLLTVLEPNQNNPKYDNYFQVQVLRDKYPLIEKFRVGTQVKVNMNVKSVEWTNPKTNDIQYFTTFSLWKIENLDSAEHSHPESYAQAENTEFSNPESNDDPF